MPPSDFVENGWAIRDFGPDLTDWIDAARVATRAALIDPAMQHWHVCEDTWFVGVDALPNDSEGRLHDVPLPRALLDWVSALTGPVPPLHSAQASVVFPGYPRPRVGESAAAFRYRQNRDAAHVDGLRAEGPDKRRRIAEPHAFILGIPLTTNTINQAPLVVWEGSHRIIGAALRAALADIAPDQHAQNDITKAYQAARRDAFSTCTRLPLVAGPGEAVLLHRHMLHGVAGWAKGTDSHAHRAVAYFRPICLNGVTEWLSGQP